MRGARTAAYGRPENHRGAVQGGLQDSTVDCARRAGLRVGGGCPHADEPQRHAVRRTSRRRSSEGDRLYRRLPVAPVRQSRDPWVRSKRCNGRQDHGRSRATRHRRRRRMTVELGSGDLRRTPVKPRSAGRSGCHPPRQQRAAGKREAIRPGDRPSRPQDLSGPALRNGRAPLPTCR